MLATLTSKGQVTLPKGIRDQLELDTGTVLDFTVLNDSTIQIKPIRANARRIRGLLTSPLPVPMDVAQMDEALAQHLQRKHAVAPRRTTGKR